MKVIFSRKLTNNSPAEEDYSPVTLHDSIQKTRQALDLAYAGFDDALDTDLIDSYIYEITALQKRYKYLLGQAALEDISEEIPSNVHSPVRALVGHVFG